MKKGFTLIEVLAVIVILSIVIGMAVYSSNRVKDSSLEKLLQTKIDNLESAAIMYGQDNPEELNESCTIFEVDYSNCMTVTVNVLIDGSYFKSTETDSEGKVTLINNVTKESMLDDKLTIYRKNNRIYALYIGS